MVASEVWDAGVPCFHATKSRVSMFDVEKTRQSAPLSRAVKATPRDARWLGGMFSRDPGMSGSWVSMLNVVQTCLPVPLPRAVKAWHPA